MFSPYGLTAAFISSDRSSGGALDFIGVAGSAQSFGSHARIQVTAALDDSATGTTSEGLLDPAYGLIHTLNHPFPIRLAQFELLQLPGGCSRQLVAKFNRRRALIVGQTFAAMGNQFCFVR